MQYMLGDSSAASIDAFVVQRRIRQILKHTPLEDKTILDIGCGNGLYILALANLAKESVGIDMRREALIEAIKNKAKLGKDTEFVRALAEELPFSDHSFDIVLVIDVLEHVRSDEKTIEEANRVLKYNGWLVIYVPNKLHPLETHGLRIGNKYYKMFNHSVPFLSWAPKFVRRKFAVARIYNNKQIFKLVEKYGFTVQHVDYIYPPLDKFRSSELIKGVLRKIMFVLEHNRLLKRFGMFIFIVARKGTR